MIKVYRWRLLSLILVPSLSFAQTVAADQYSGHKSDYCLEVEKNINAIDETPYELAQGTYVVRGDGRLQFLYAPARDCSMTGIFVIPGDEVDPDFDYKEFTYVEYTNPKTRKHVEGWVETDRLKQSGRRAYLQ